MTPQTPPPSESYPDLLKPTGPNLGLAPPRGATGPRRGMFSSLAHRHFRNYLVGLGLSNVGSWMQTVAQGWLVLEISNSALVLGAVTFAGSIPSLVLAPLAGVAADRYDRRKLLLATQTIQMATALVLAAATGWGFVSVPLVAAMAVIAGSANAMTTPSHQSLFLDLVGRDNLMNAIALNSMQFNLSRVLGPMAAGLTIAAFGETACFLLNAVSFVAILVPLARLPARHKRRAHGHGAWIEARLGLRFARKSRLVPQLLVISAALAVFGTPAVTLAPLFAKKLLHVGPEKLGGMLAAVGLGAVATGLGLASLGDFRRKGLAVVVAAALFGVSLAGFAFSPGYGAAMAWLAVLGGAMMSSSSLVNTLVQKSAPDRLRGRVISLYALAWLGLVPIGNLFAGVVAEHYGPAAALWVGSLGIFATLGILAAVRPVPLDAH
jgi:MFS family permease